MWAVRVRWCHELALVARSTRIKLPTSNFPRQTNSNSQGSGAQTAALRLAPVWRALVLAIFAPIVVALLVVLWRTPFPLSEGVSLIEDVARNPPSHFLRADSAYYRPLFHITLSTLWRDAGSVEGALQAIKLLHLVPVSLVVLLFIWHVRPRDAIDAGAATLALAVLVGAPAFRDNLEIPLSYTTVGIPIALVTWIVLERQHRWWHEVAIVALLVVAVGFKEQGLVLVPVVIAAWIGGAPGVRRGTVIVVTLLAVAYVAFRLANRGSGPLFEQDVGVGFVRLSPAQTEARFGSFPLLIFAYNGLATIANVLVSEPTAGVFSVVSSVVRGRPDPVGVLNVVSSVATTALIVWWASSRLWGPAVDGSGERRPSERRLAIALVVALAACGALSFDYSRDRLGGMAIVFYALAAFHAIRALAIRLAAARLARFRVGVVGLLLLAGAWQIRALGTLEGARETAFKNRREWITGVASRRVEFADRPVYLQLMERLEPQGISDTSPQPTRYRRTAARLIRGR